MKIKKMAPRQILYLLILLIIAACALLLGVFILFAEIRGLIQRRQERLELSQAIAKEIKNECARYNDQFHDGAGSNLMQNRNELRSRLSHNLSGKFGYQARFNYEIVDSAGHVLLSSLNKGRLNSPLARGKLDFAYPPWRLGASFYGYGPPLSFITTRRIAIGVTALLVIGAVMVSGRMLRHEKELARLKSQFVSHVSHEMRTPTATIRMIAEMFKMGKVKNQVMANEYYDILLSESERLTAMIVNVLDFARIESNRKTYTINPCDPRKITIEAINLFKTFVIAKGFQVKCDIQPDLPWINADVDAMTQVICNLLDNAAKYSLGKKEINVRLFFREGWIALEVEDRGIGIDPQKHEEIFEPFYRVDDALINKIPGTGVGLAIVNNVVKAHKGRISVNSRPGQGSTFTVLLPVIEEGKKT